MSTTSVVAKRKSDDRLQARPAGSPSTNELLDTSGVSQPFHSSRDGAWRSHAQRLATIGGSENRKEAVEKKQIVESHEPHWPSIWIYLGFVVVLAAAELALGWSLFQGYLLLACALILLIAHRVVAFSLFNIQFHGVHHRYARIPQARLPMLIPLLEPTLHSELAPYRSYREAMWDMLRSLRNPRVGAQWISE
jgi:hypothetical protein